MMKSIDVFFPYRAVGIIEKDDKVINLKFIFVVSFIPGFIQFIFNWNHVLKLNNFYSIRL